MQGKKRSTYDELSIPEWAVGQLTSIFHVQNSDTIRKALLQTILVLKDATSLPWPAVRAAYGTSMHQVELGNLSWGDQMHWASMDHLHHKSLWQILIFPQITRITEPKYPDTLKKVCVLLSQTTDSTDMFEKC